jgi:ferredoxin
MEIAGEDEAVKIIVNRSLCDGNGLCVRQAPDLLKLDEHDTPHALRETFFNEDHVKQARLAVLACPKAALVVSE